MKTKVSFFQLLPISGLKGLIFGAQKVFQTRYTAVLIRKGFLWNLQVKTIAHSIYYKSENKAAGFKVSDIADKCSRPA